MEKLLSFLVAVADMSQRTVDTLERVCLMAQLQVQYLLHLHQIRYTKQSKLLMAAREFFLLSRTTPVM